MKQIGKGIFGGMFISLGAFAYLVTLQKTNNAFLASMMFFIGLLLVMVFKQRLFTGEVLTLTHLDTRAYVINLIGTWILNFIGAIITTILLNQILPITIIPLIHNKLSLNYTQILISGMFCNFFVCSAIASYKATENYLISGFLITCFVLLGLEHSVADMSYFTLAFITGLNTNIPQLLTYILLATIGNFLGGRLVDLMIKTNWKSY